MRQEAKMVFRLTPKEIREALYDFYVKRFQYYNINTVFSEDEIEIDYNDFLDVLLPIEEVKTLD